MSRFSVAIVTLAVGLVIGVGCGGSNTVSTSGHGASPSAGGQVTKSQATAYAHAVNLKPGDAPELTAVGNERETEPKKRGEEAARCAGAESRSRRVVDVSSAKLSGASSSPREVIGSEVAVWSTTAAAEHNAAAETGPRGRACTQHLLERLALKTLTSRVHIAHVSVAWRPAPLQATKASYAARVTLTVAAEGPRSPAGTTSAALESPSPGTTKVKVPVYLDVEGFQAGPAQVTLTALGVKQAPSSSAEHRLLSLLYSRAQSHRL